MEIKIININGVRQYIDVMYNDFKNVEKGYKIMVSYNGCDIKRVIDYFYKIEEEKQQLTDRINKAIEYINKFENIKAYYSYEENGYEEYNYDEDFKIDLLEILKGGEEEC